MTPPLRVVLSAVVFCVCALAHGPAVAQSQPAAAPPSREAVEAKIAGLPETESVAREQYREALAFLERYTTLTQRAGESRRRAAEAPALLASIRSDAEASPESVGPQVPEGATLAQLEQGASQVVARLELARAEVSDLQAEASRRQERRAQIPEAIATARQRLSQVDDASAGSVPDGSRNEVTVAMEARGAAERAALLAEIAALEAELAEYDARREVLPARRDRAARRVTSGERLSTDWQAIVSVKRRQEAERAAKDAERLSREAARQHPVLQRFAAESQRLAEARTGPDGIPQKITGTRRGAGDADAALRTIRDQYSKVRRRIDAGGLTRATGLLLRRHYELLKANSMTNLSQLRRRAAEIQRSLERAEYTLIEREDDRDDARDIDGVVDSLMEAIRASGEQGGDLVTLEKVARDLADARKEIQELRVSDAVTYSSELVALERETADLRDAVTAYESFIRERILWVRSIARGTGASPDQLREATDPVLGHGAWAATIERTGVASRHAWVPLVLSAVAVVLVFLGGMLGRRRLGATSALVGRFRTDTFRHTLIAMACTLVGALPVAVLFWVSGRLLVAVPDQALLGRALGAGLIASAKMQFALSVARLVFRTGGLAEGHFRWHPTVVLRCRRIARWLQPFMVIAVGALAVSDTIGSEAADATLGRLSFTAMLLLAAAAIGVLARPRGPFAEMAARRGGWTERLRVLWMPLLPLLPVALAVLAWLGYFYTARQLGQRLEATVLLGGVLLLVHSMLMRWLFITRRRVAVEEAKRRREQAIADQAAGRGATEELPSEAAATIDEDKIDLPAISQQTQQLFRAGLLAVAVIGLFVAWAEVLPALRIFDRVQVYPAFGVIEAAEVEAMIPILESRTGSASTGATGAAPGGSAPGGEGSLALPIVSPVGSVYNAAPADGGDAVMAFVTLSDVGLGIVLLTVTIVAFRNLPGLVEIVVFARLPLDAGSRYALSTVLRYLIAIVGIAAAFGAVDLTWANIQWLAAALTFGLAFGLQEIFANFVSGLIILAERPIRIGDTVTVGSVNGTVTRIRMRATVITDWDRKELIIPNKTFITNDVINWTLSDSVLRMTIQVGIGYGDDVRKAEAVLRKIGAAAPNVLKDPGPFVVFNGFGDSTLNFELRVFLPHVDHLIRVRHDLHMRIIEAFRAEGIEIAFPQRDLHVRSFEGLDRIAGVSTENRAPGA